ncbi:MAG: branched-chain amino acid aminotransferase [Desulfovibrionales bacterium]|nr:branched-chain amino acid aminotransferase [Desulfovibrionales bacterium]
MVQQSSKIWFDGKFVDWADAKVHVLTHTLHYGAGVFEGIRAYECKNGKSAIFRLKEHMRRLLDSAHILNLKVPYSQEELNKAAVETMQVNGMKNGYLRPLVFVGAGVMGVYPGDNPIQTIIAAWPWGAYLGKDALEKGIRIKTSSFSRHHVNVMMTKAKVCGNYVNSVLAKQEAVAEGFDECMMLDSHGFVSEGSGENIYIVRDGKIKTPPLNSVLPGITRNSLLVLAKDLGYEIVEQNFTRDEVYVADEVFFSGTAAELTPIREVDHRQIGEGSAGPVTKKLQQEFFKIVAGENEKYADWLYYYEV